MRPSVRVDASDQMGAINRLMGGVLVAGREALVEPSTGGKLNQASYQRLIFVRLGLEVPRGRLHFETGRNMVPAPLVAAASFVSQVGIDTLMAISYSRLSPEDRQLVGPPVRRERVGDIGARQLGEELLAALRDEAWRGERGAGGTVR